MMAQGKTKFSLNLALLGALIVQCEAGHLRSDPLDRKCLPKAIARRKPLIGSIGFNLEDTRTAELDSEGIERNG